MATSRSVMLEGLLKLLEAPSLMDRMFGMRTSGKAFDIYETHVNGTLREVQQLAQLEADFTLPIQQVRTLYMVYWHLSCLVEDLSDSESPTEISLWEHEQATCCRQWENLVQEKGYPFKMEEMFREYGSMAKTEMDEILGGAKCQGFLPTTPSLPKTEFTVYWHLGLLCDSLPDGTEKRQWVSKQSSYLTSKAERKEADDYVNQLIKAIPQVYSIETGEKCPDDLLDIYDAGKQSMRDRNKQKLLDWTRDWGVVLRND